MQMSQIYSFAVPRAPFAPYRPLSLYIRLNERFGGTYTLKQKIWVEHIRLIKKNWVEHIRVPILHHS